MVSKAGERHKKEKSCLVLRNRRSDILGKEKNDSYGEAKICPKGGEKNPT